MGLGLLKFANKLLAKKGLIIKDKNYYEEAIALNGMEWLKNLNIKTVLDVGASDGGYATLARKIFPDSTIFSFEPIPESFAKLTSKFGANSKHILFNFACSETNQQIEFYQNSINDCSSILEMAELHKLSYEKTKESKKTNVIAKTLDSALQDYKLDENILLKIDVQGSESKVFKGAAETLQKVKVVFIETSFNELYKGQWLFHDTYTFLTKNGFKLVGIENISQNIHDGTYLQMDAYFIKQ